MSATPGKPAGQKGAPAAAGKGGDQGAPSGGNGLCTAQGCKAKEAKFSFCSEHYDHFKFGLITRLGKPVSDYDKKFEHYQHYKESLTKRKAA
ncbi:MAG: hypothetical protein AB7P04_12745 [Bacteriovoracia bacterium]